MKRMIIIFLLMLCPVGYSCSAESSANSSFDVMCNCGAGFSPGTVIYLPDFTGTGSHWGILSEPDWLVRAVIAPVAQSAPSDNTEAITMYQLKLEGVSSGDGFVHLELYRDGTASWRYNLYIIVDPSLDVKIQTAELMPAYGDTSHTSIDYGTSDHFTRDEMDAAIAVILADFSARHKENPDPNHDLSAWVGYVLQEVAYSSDEKSYLKFEEYGHRYGVRDSQNRPYTDGIVFYTAFRTPMTDDGWTGFECARTYSGYEWILFLTQDRQWDIISMGY